MIEFKGGKAVSVQSITSILLESVDPLGSLTSHWDWHDCALSTLANAMLVCWLSECTSFMSSPLALLFFQLPLLGLPLLHTSS